MSQWDFFVASFILFFFFFGTDMVKCKSLYSLGTKGKRTEDLFIMAQQKKL